MGSKGTKHNTPLSQRLASSTDGWGSPDRCWIWHGTRNKGGYGRIAIKGIPKQAHRVVYEVLVGPIGAGLTLDHLCRNRACVNPSHLEPVTNKVNVLRGTGHTATNSRKTHCPAGHQYTPENTYTGSHNDRHCRACGRAYAHRAYARRQRAALALGERQQEGELDPGDRQGAFRND